MHVIQDLYFDKMATIFKSSHFTFVRASSSKIAQSAAPFAQRKAKHSAMAGKSLSDFVDEGDVIRWLSDAVVEDDSGPFLSMM